MFSPAVMPCLFACAMVAAMKTRLAGGHVTGAVMLGLVCGFVPGIAHGALFGEAGAAIFGVLPFSIAAVSGAVAGALAGAVTANNIAERLFFWLESLALGLTACVFADMSFRTTMGDNPCVPALIALFSGFFCTLAPAFVRDVAIGDSAVFVDESWYATAAALGIMLTLALRHFFPVAPTPLAEGVPTGQRPFFIFLPPVGGTLLVVLLRWRRRKSGLQ